MNTIGICFLLLWQLNRCQGKPLFLGKQWKNPAGHGGGGSQKADLDVEVVLEGDLALQGGTASELGQPGVLFGDLGGGIGAGNGGTSCQINTNT